MELVKRFGIKGCPRLAVIWRKLAEDGEYWYAGTLVRPDGNCTEPEVWQSTKTKAEKVLRASVAEQMRLEIACG